jgi:hypothetical protein
MFALLSGPLPDDALSADEIERAARFAYLWFFRYVVRVPLLRPRRGPFALTTFRELAPGGHAVIDELCRAMLTGEPFLDLNGCES